MKESCLSMLTIICMILSLLTLSVAAESPVFTAAEDAVSYIQ